MEPQPSPPKPQQQRPHTQGHPQPPRRQPPQQHPVAPVEPPVTAPSPGSAAGGNSLPLCDISVVAKVDVLCGRGGGTNHHTGNNHWRALVSANKRLYISLPKRQKVLVAKSIVHAIRSQANPHGGRFLLKDPSTNLWSDIGDQKAIEKTSQALREGAPDIRSKMEDQHKDKSSSSASPQDAGAKEDLKKYQDNSAVALGVGKEASPDSGIYKPGQILPNGLITLDYDGVQSAMARAARGPPQDGTIDINHNIPSVGDFRDAARQLGAPPQATVQAQPGAQSFTPMDPMMQAFQQFMGVQQHKRQLPQNSADTVSMFQQVLKAGTNHVNLAPQQHTGQEGEKPVKVQVNCLKSLFSHLLQDERTQQKLPTSLQQEQPRPSPSSDVSAPTTAQSAPQIAQTTKKGLLPPSYRTMNGSVAMDGHQALVAVKTLGNHGISLRRQSEPMTHELALQILLREKALKLQQDRDESLKSANVQLTSSFMQSMGDMGANELSTSADRKLNRLGNEFSFTGGADGLAGGTGGGHIPYSTSLLADYLVQNNVAVSSVTQLPVSGEKIRSMTDEQIRGALHQLECQKLKSTHGIATAADSETNLFGLSGHTGVTRGSSLMSALLEPGTGTKLPFGKASGDPTNHGLVSSDMYNSKYAGGYHGLLERGISRSVTRSETLGLQQAVRDVHLRQNDAPGLETTESERQTLLRPGASATLSQLKYAQLKTMGLNSRILGFHNLSAGDGSNGVSWVPPCVGGSITRPRGQVEITSTPKRGASGGSLDELCRVAKMHMEEAPGVEAVMAETSLQMPDGDLLRGSSLGSGLTNKLSRGMSSSGVSQKMRMFQGLMDSEQVPVNSRQLIQRSISEKACATEQCLNLLRPLPSPVKAGGTSASDWVLAQEWENVKMSNARRAALKLGKNDQSLVDDSDDDADVRGVIPSRSKRSRESYPDDEVQRSPKRLAGTDNAKRERQLMAHNGHSASLHVGGQSFSHGLGFSRETHAPMPIMETVLDHGHSMAMSEISLDRGHSLADGVGMIDATTPTRSANAADEGQFDDASEEGIDLSG